MPTEKNDSLFYALGLGDRFNCPECGNGMNLARSEASNLLGEGYEVHRFACECGFELERHSDPAAKVIIAKTAQ
jgi:predicted RNA-binding Zn-ribbon protein involved in translation (DUF1610 family)